MQSQRTENLQDWIEENGYLVHPTETVLRELADTLTADGETVRMLVEETTLRSIDREYTTASRLAQLEREGTVEFRTLSGDYQTNLVSTESVTGAFIDLDELTVAIGSDDNELVDEALLRVEELWEAAETTYLRTPPADEVEEAFNSQFDPVVYEDFIVAVTAMENAARAAAEPDNATFPDRRHTYASLLVAGAVNKVSLRELGRSAEYCGISSRSTLSRVKQELEDGGYITTTTIETDVGRPPMRLQTAGLYSGDDAEMMAERVYDDLQSDGELGEESSE